MGIKSSKVHVEPQHEASAAAERVEEAAASLAERRHGVDAALADAQLWSREVKSYVAGAVIARHGPHALTHPVAVARGVKDWLENNKYIGLSPNPRAVAQIITAAVTEQQDPDFDVVQQDPDEFDVVHFIAGLGSLEPDFDSWLGGSSWVTNLIRKYVGDHADRAVYDEARAAAESRRRIAEEAAETTTGLHAAVVLHF